MNKLTVIESPPKPPQKDKSSIYLRILKGFIETGIHTEEDRLKAFYHLAKYVALSRGSLPIEIFFAGNDLLKGVSTAKFAQYFPPEKRYYGERYRTKDYFTSLEALKQQGETIREPFEFLMDYQNDLLMSYVVAQMITISHLHEEETGKSMLEDFFGITPMRLYEDKGKQYLYDPKTQKTIPVKPAKKRPRWIKVVR